ncbi:hypothetical protein FIBSPDRAFT_719555 [Athelia psychrophila]|uniref:Uncharacterized protein n=1 Tax=Athelia psychrophila TaxID=1759441 RepID=A0A166X5V8_9AGAM|nr:hypothetical protein FIBSPDRAFT_719555 [Fibularhizoctonia sp. CBS 109695]
MEGREGLRGDPEEYDSDSSDKSIESRRSFRNPAPLPPWYSFKRLPTVSNLHRSIIKCVIAYFIASLFTFTPYLSSFIADISSDNEPGTNAPSPAGHMVATVAVYFNPAKTVGGMVEADMYCFLGLAYASFISLSSMAMFWWIDLKPGFEWLADLFAILWIGFGMAGVTWTKSWMNKPSFGTACSMTVIVLFVVVVNEGGLDTLLSVGFIVFVGAAVSNIVCYLVWPQRATVNLQDNMAKTLDSFSTLLQMLTDTFLLEEPLHQPSHSKLQKAIQSHQSSFTSLKKNLGEAHSEWFSGGPSGDADAARAYEDAIDSLNRLAQHLNGLRSGTQLQYNLSRAHAEGKVVLKNRTQKTTADNGNGKGGEDAGLVEDNALLQAAATMFGDLIDDLGPPLKALSSSCTSGLQGLREAFTKQARSATDVVRPKKFADLADAIERALFTFESTSNHALMRLYQRSEMSAAPSHMSFASTEEGSVLGAGESESETVFLVYFFIFTLQEFAQELVSLVDAMHRISSIAHIAAERTSSRVLSDAYNSVRAIIKRSWKSAKPISRPSIQPAIVMNRKERKPDFPKVKPHAPNTMQTPSRSDLKFMGRVKQSLWAFGARVQQRDIKHAFKAGMGMAILAAPAFFDSTRPMFMRYRGEWALISFFLVISPTIGATNFLSAHRVMGTLMGAAVAAIFFELFRGDPVALSIMGAIYSIPCFYYIVAVPTLASPARFNLLTYNLICLYCYNLREDDLSVVDIALHRSAAVIVGVVWAAVLSRFWWPAQARRELSIGLGEFCLNIGWLYTRLVASYSFAPEFADNPEGDRDENSTEGTPLLSRSATTKLNNSIHEFMAMELHLQIKLIELQGLLAQTQHEPRLKGPFPVALYRSILTSLQTILDKLHSMRCVTTREEWLVFVSNVRQDFIIPVNKERREMVGNIILYFSTLASAFQLKAPLPPFMPQAEQSRQRLVNAIRRLDVVRNREVKGSKHLLFFAYTLMMQGVIQELEYLGSTLQTAFGVIGQSPGEFEALFRDERTEASRADVDIV